MRIDLSKPIFCLNCGSPYPTCQCDGEPYWGDPDHENERL